MDRTPIGPCAASQAAVFASGGQRISTGLDNGAAGGVAHDGALDDGEIESTSYVCNAAPAAGGCSTTGGLSFPLALLVLAGGLSRRAVRVAR